MTRHHRNKVRLLGAVRTSIPMGERSLSLSLALSPLSALILDKQRILLYYCQSSTTLFGFFFFFCLLATFLLSQRERQKQREIENTHESKHPRKPRQRTRIDFAEITLAKLCVRTCYRHHESCSSHSLLSMDGGTDGWRDGWRNRWMDEKDDPPRTKPDLLYK